MARGGTRFLGAAGPAVSRADGRGPRFVGVGGAAAPPVEITAIIEPAIAPLEDGETIASALSADIDQTSNYASTGGDIDSATVSVTVNDEPVIDLDDIVFEGDDVFLSVLVADDASNTRTFTASRTVAAGEAEPDLPTIDFVDFDTETKSLFIATSAAGTVYWSTTAAPVTDAQDVIDGIGAEDSGNYEADAGLNEDSLDLSNTTTGEPVSLNMVLRVGEVNSLVLTESIQVPDPVEAWEVQQTAINNNTSSATSLPLVLTDAPEEGNELVAVIGTNPSQGASTITPPAGWSLLCTTATSRRLAFFRKTAGASEPDTYTFTFADSRRPKGIILELAPPAGGVNVASTDDIQTATGTSLTIGPSANSIPAGGLAIAALLSPGGSIATEEWTNGFVSVATTSQSPNVNHANFDVAFLIPGSSGTQTTVTGVDESGALTGLIAGLEEAG